MHQVLEQFHPAVSGWFSKRFGAPTEPQVQAWPAIRERSHTLIAAPTGSGKTLAAFLSAIDGLVRRAACEPLSDAVEVVYISPLKALSNDIRKNLDEPLSGIAKELHEMGLADPGIRAMVRTGDTPAARRAAMARRPPHILVTTPESLYILLTSESGRRMLQTARTAIVDEIHAVADDKRGSHLSLSLERLDALVREHGGELARIGLSATQRPIETVARFLTGSGADADEPAGCTIIDTGHRREMDLALELPGSPLEAVMANEVWDEIYDRLVELIETHTTTLIFVNTRRLAERVARHLSDRIDAVRVASHHGSLSRERRLDAEQRLKEGKLDALVATASLELGIDIGDVDLVCILGSPRSIATLLQRVGRSGHCLGAVPKGRVFPTSRDELVECAALLAAVKRGDLERLVIPISPLDILAQQIVAAVACEEWNEDELFDLVRRAWPYRGLQRARFDEVLQMLASGFSTHRGRRGAMLHHDRVNRRIRPRRGARLAALTSGGAIPDNADYRVVLEAGGVFLGTVDEDFAIESLAGDIFQLGNHAWRIRKIEQGRVLVEDALGKPPNIPFWFGEAPGRSDELSRAVSALRAEVSRRLEQPGSQGPTVDWLAEQVGRPAAEQIVLYLATAHAGLGVLPSRETLVLERFFDEAGDQHVVIHSPFGSRLNRAWGLALRKRFCRSFNFELQAAATEDAILLSLGPTHSFPAEDTFRFLHSSSVREVLVQALLDAPMFPIRWRWNAGRSLALLRFQGGRRVPPRLQRMQAEDLIAVVFPDQLACLENVAGDREIPDHPLVAQTIEDCLNEAMDIDELEGLLRAIEAGEKQLVVRELREPSPLAYEILNAKPYAFLDDAPLEERRTQAVRTRRWLDPSTASDLGKLDAEAIERVCREAWPVASDADELHDALATLGFATAEEGARCGWRSLFDALIGDGRAASLLLDPATEIWAAVDRMPELQAAFPEATIEPRLSLPGSIAGQQITTSDAWVSLVRARLSSIGPVTALELAGQFGGETAAIDGALAALEGEGFAMQGRFTPGIESVEWCDRRLLARIHRYTLNRLRREIEPATKTDFTRFLLEWQRVDPEHRASGAESLAAIVGQLVGFGAPAAAWEGEILPARLADYDPLWLDALCLSGRFTWGRFAGRRQRGVPGSRPIRTTSISLLERGETGLWQDRAADDENPAEELSGDARRVHQRLESQGARFFDEIQKSTGLLRTQVENALAELVGRGLVTSDAFTGLRALLTPSDRRPPISSRRRGKSAIFGMQNAGRWSLLVEGRPEQDESSDGPETIARTLLGRYGVVCRGLLVRESLAPPWRELLPVLRRLEARGDIRGGRFVDGFSGEQFALPEAIGKLRAVRRRPTEGACVSISAADPINLPGLLGSEARIPAVAGNRILIRDGQAIATLVSGETRFLVEMSQSRQWEAGNALVRRRLPPKLRAYLGRPA